MKPSEYGSPLVKICGLTRPEDALAAVELGADLIGLNFYLGSSRYLTVEQARPIADAVRGRCRLVGVFVNSSPARVREIREDLGLDLVQLHGDEPDEEVRAWGDQAIKVFRVEGAPDLEGPSRFPEAWGFLYDVKHSAYGGTGTSWNYSSLAGLEASAEVPGKDRKVEIGPVLVAGGIRPGNARDALEASGAAGVDACSGIESAPGIKDRRLMEQLFAEVRHG